MNKEQEAVIWKIIGEVASEDTTYETGMGDIECVFCGGDNYSSKEFKHEDDCIVTRARTLIAEIAQQVKGQQ